MTTKKSEYSLSLPNENAGLEAYFAGGQLAVAGGPSRGDLRKVDQEFQTQAAVIDASSIKTIHGMARLGQLEQTAAVQFEQTARVLAAVKGMTKGQDHRTNVEKFCDRMAEVSARHMLGAVEIGAAGIAREIHRPLYPIEEDEAQPRSLWEKLFGR